MTWITSAGNAQWQIWHGAFRDSDNPKDRIHDYTTTSTSTSERNYVMLGASFIINAEMRWDDDWPGADCDFTMTLYKARTQSSPGYWVRKSTQSQAGQDADRPFESLSYYMGRALGTHYFYLEIQKAQNPAPSQSDPCDDVDWMQIRVNKPHYLHRSRTGHSLTYPADSKSPGMLTVGGAKHDAITQIWASSSQGPTQDGREKPDLVGATCGQALAMGKTNILEVQDFCGTSQSAPHVSGLAALAIDRYDTPEGTRQYTTEDVADWLKSTASARGTVPNNAWGHGFAMLPNPAPTASLSPAPTLLNVGTRVSPTVATQNAGTSVNIVVNRDEDTGNLTLNGICPGAEGVGVSGTNGGTVRVKGCVPGKVNVRVYKRGAKVLLASYPVTILSTATRLPLKVGTVATQSMSVGASNAKTLDMSGYFNYEEWYTFAVSDDTVLQASMGDASLKLTGLKTGSTVVTVTGHNGYNGGSEVLQTFTVNVGGTTTTPTADPPSVNAGEDKRVTAGTWVSVSGSGRPNNEDDDVAFAWAQDPAPGGGPRVAMKKPLYAGSNVAYVPNSPGSDTFRFQAPSTSGTVLTFTLTVTDGGTSRTATDSMTVTVR